MSRLLFVVGSAYTVRRLTGEDRRRGHEVAAPLVEHAFDDIESLRR